MIEVEHLTKTFAGIRALDDVSFSVAEGEILGFLGPNGAGKSTTMRILTGFMPGDSGTVRVAGHDVTADSLAVRREIGYLPEGVPLYPDMRVVEYLRFRSRIKGVPRRQRAAAVDRALELTHIRDRRRQMIGTLSRGYRQRVGLADALLAEPKVLILDEPTVGLDPEQIRQFRHLLKGIGQDRTVVLSTHILSEAELVCSSVVIIHEGRVVARDRASELRRRVGGMRRIIVEVAAAAKDARARFGAIDGVTRVSVTSDVSDGYRRCVLDCADEGDLRPLVFDAALGAGWRLRELCSEEVSLEDAFVRIVGEENR